MAFEIRNVIQIKKKKMGSQRVVGNDASNQTKKRDIQLRLILFANNRTKLNAFTCFVCRKMII